MLVKSMTFIKLPVVINPFVLSIFEWPFYTGFTVVSEVGVLITEFSIVLLTRMDF